MNRYPRFHLSLLSHCLKTALLFLAASLSPFTSQVVVAQEAGVQADKDVRVLEPGKPVERELAGGQAHSYQITLAAGQYLSVVVEQRGIDVVVTLMGPDGKQIAEFDNELRTQGQESVTQVAETAGRYRLEVKPKQRAVTAGGYEIRVVEVRAAIENDRALQEARNLYAESARLDDAGKYDEALPPAERALEMREKALGSEHPLVATSLNNLAMIYVHKGDYVKAELLHRRALNIREKMLGPEHPDVASDLNNLGFLYNDKGDYAKAESFYRRALDIYEKTLGPEHPGVATALNNLGLLYSDIGDYAKAEPLYQRALAIREKTLGPEHPDVASSLNSLGLLYERKGDYAKAELFYRRALAIREKTLGPEDRAVAQPLNNLASLYRRKGEYVKAEPLHQRALAIYEKTFGALHPSVALSLNNLATLYATKGDYARAEPLFLRALVIREKALGPEHPEIARPLYNLGLLYEIRGDYVKAEPFYQRALAIREKTLGPEHPDVARSLNSLASLYGTKGDYAKAVPLYQRALVIREKTLGPEHPDVAYTLTNLATIYTANGDYMKAESFYQRALAIREKSLVPEHPDVALSLNNLAGLYATKGDYAKAEPLHQRALVILEKTLGPEHPDVAVPLNNLAILYAAKGEYAKAEPLQQRALAIYEKTLGAQHPLVATFLCNFAGFSAARGDMTQAIEFQSRAAAVSERNIGLNLAIGSERQKLAYLATLSTQADQTVSLHVRAAPNDPTARTLATTTILQRKGRALDATFDNLGALRRRFNAQDQALLDQLKDAHAQLARLVLGGPQRIPPAEHQRQIKALEEQKEKLEAEISSRSAEFRVQSQPVTLEAVQSAIPTNVAVIEFFSFRPFNAKYTKPTEAFGPPRYVAYVLRQQGEPQWVELGEAKVIDDAVAALRRALRDPKRADVKRLARKVDEQVMRPVRALLGETRQVLISPDGSLNLVPFAALVDERNRYLVTRYSFSYLTSGRDLLRLQLRQPSRQDPVVVADPAFGELASGEAPASRDLGLPDGSQQPVAQSIGLAQFYFPPLPGAASEARALRTVLPQATMLTGQKATETALKQVGSPTILHVATHGFFLQDVETRTAGARDFGLLGDGQLSIPPRQFENPLLRSGLALAGANERKSGPNKEDDGVLTALEAAGLDLWGTKLVVLSACDTGVGEVKNGDGVYGLRRALVLAGSESQVMSLWAVSDWGTRDLMVDYYRALQQGQGRGEALRQVQLRMLRSKNRQHPYYWAGFIQSGEWANLEGKR